jgi:hypothetical protein
MFDDATRIRKLSDLEYLVRFVADDFLCTRELSVCLVEILINK